MKAWLFDICSKYSMSFKRFNISSKPGKHSLCLNYTEACLSS